MTFRIKYFANQSTENKCAFSCMNYSIIFTEITFYPLSSNNF